MKTFGEGSSLFYLKNNAGKIKKVSITNLSNEKIVGEYRIDFEPSKEEAKILILKGNPSYKIEISSRYLEKCEDLCGNTFVTLVPDEETVVNFKQILITL